MKPLKTIIFGLIFVVMALYYYEYEVKRIEEIRLVKEEEKKVFPGITKDEIQKFTIHGPKGEATLQKEGEIWMLKSPVEAKGDLETAKSFLENIADFQLESVIAENPTEYKDFGLEAPYLKIDFFTEKGDKSLWIGIDNPTNTLAYGKTSSDPRIFSFATILKKQLDRGPYDLRDKTILPIEKDEVKRVSLSGQGMALEARLSEGKEWEVTSPFQWRAEKEKLNDLIQSFQGPQIKRFVSEKPDNLEEFGLAVPAYTMAFFPEKDGEKAGHRLLIGKKEEGQNRYYAKREGTENVFLIDGNIVGKIPQKAEDLRDKKLLTMKDSEDVAGLRFSGQETVEIKKSEKGDWEMIEPRKTKADLFEANQWADRVAKITIMDFLDGATKEADEYGLQSPEANIEVWGKTADKPQKILLGKEVKDGKGRYIALADFPNVFIIGQEIYKGLLVTGMQMRNKKIVHIDTGKIERIEAIKGAQKVVLEKFGEEWKVQSTGKKVEGNDVRGLLWDAIDLEFTTVVSEGGAELDRFGLAVPVVSLKLRKAKGEIAGEIRIGNLVPADTAEKVEHAEGEGGVKYYATNETGNEVYEVKTGLVTELEKKLEEWSLKHDKK
jgi:hypothetical protein